MYSDNAAVTAVHAGVTGTAGAAMIAPLQVAMGLGVVAAVIVAMTVLMMLRARRLASR